jgi:hypothetical protein
MPSYFPENNDPKPMDSADRSLQKINSLLAGGVSISGGVTGDVSVTNGTSGGQFIADTNAVSGSFSAIQIVADAKFHTLTGNVTGVANTTSGSAATFPLGIVIYGSFTAIQLHSGSVIAYS